MRHLRPSEIIDAAEGSLTAERAAHLHGCARCRDQVSEASAVLSEVRTVEAPEPSPLFWDHFSARVRERIDAEPAASAGWRRWMWAPAGLLAASVAVVIALSNAPLGDRPGLVPAATPPTAAERPPGVVDDSSWTLVSEETGEVAWDDVEAAGLVVRPGAADHAAMQLSDDQQQELARLLRAEMSRLKS